MEIHIHKVDFLWITIFAVFCQRVYNVFRIAVFDYAVHDEVGPHVEQKTARPLNKRSRAWPECVRPVGTRVRWGTGLRLGWVGLGIAPPHAGNLLRAIGRAGNLLQVGRLTKSGARGL